MLRRKPEKCPYCGGGDMLPIVYGLPSGEFRDAAKGKIRFGGCCDPGNGPEWFCKTCESKIPENEIKDWLPLKRGKPMRISYDEEADAMYIALADAQSVAQRQVTEDFIVDIDEDGNVIGIEILDACATYGQAIVKAQWGSRGCKVGAALEE